jgi:UDP-N-acetylglucosamine:LPS N-acetylglucosamine transferase
MKKEETPLEYDAVAVLSGPEPQRSLLEEKVLEQMKRLKGRFAVAGGKTEGVGRKNVPSHIRYYPYLTHKELNALMLSARLIICRSGYSSLMDLAVLKKPALLIPTPGQPEQEYLADLHKGAAQYCIQHQSNLKLESAIVQ